MTILEILEAIEKELRTNEIYLKQIGHFHSHYQGEKYQRLYTLIEEGKRLTNPPITQEERGSE